MEETKREEKQKAVTLLKFMGEHISVTVFLILTLFELAVFVYCGIVHLQNPELGSLAYYYKQSAEAEKSTELQIEKYSKSLDNYLHLKSDKNSSIYDNIYVCTFDNTIKIKDVKPYTITYTNAYNEDGEVMMLEDYIEEYDLDKDEKFISLGFMKPVISYNEYMKIKER